MSNIYKGEFQDYEGNVVYPHSQADVIFCTDGETVQSKLNNTESAIGGVTGRTDNAEVNDNNVLFTSKGIHDILGGAIKGFGLDESGNPGYIKAGADSVTPFKSGATLLCTVENNSYNTSSKEVDLSSFLDDITKYSADNFIIVPKSVGYYGISASGAGSSNYNPKRGTNDVSIQYDNATGKLIVNGLCAGTTFNNGYFSYYGYIASFDILLNP